MIGRGILRGRQGSERELEAILETHNIVLLNTWGTSSTSKSYTFQNGATHTQLDFLGMRWLTADQKAERSTPVDLNLVPWRQGPRHRPVSGSLKWIAGWACVKHRPVQKRFSLSCLRMHIRQNTPKALELKVIVDDLVAKQTSSPNLEVRINKSYSTASVSFRRQQTRGNDQEAQHLSPVLAGIQNMWAAYTALQEPVMGTHFQRAAEKSRRFVCFQNCTREMRAQSRKARKHGLLIFFMKQKWQ